jgi:hypothetical protein
MEDGTLLTWREVLEALRGCDGQITDFGRHAAPIFFDSVIGNSHTGERIEMEAFRILRDERWIVTEDQGEIKRYRINEDRKACVSERRSDKVRTASA